VETYNTSELQTLVESLALGEEIVVRVSNHMSHLRWRVVNTRQGYQSFVDASMEDDSHFEFLISSPRATQLLARAMVEGQVTPLLSHHDTRLACVGVGLEGADGLPKNWRRALRRGDVVLTWLDTPQEQLGVHFKLDESSTVDIRLIGEEPRVWVRAESHDGTELHIREHYVEARTNQLISRLRKGRFDGKVSTGRFTKVSHWDMSTAQHNAAVEARRGWDSQDIG
jgi:hypothetical protein